MKESEEVKRPICVVCGNGFDKCKFHPKQIYCSSKCYHIKNKDILKEKSRKKYKENKNIIKTLHVCSVCGNSFEKNNNYIQKYCSEKCKHIGSKEKRNTRRRKNYSENKEKYRIKRIEKKEYYKEYSKQYRSRDGYGEYCRSYYHNIIKNDKTSYLGKILRLRIWKAIRDNYSEKSFNTIELLGCTIQEAKEHLEKQFKEGMTWENHGINGWHIDHIIPCASFDLTDPEQQKKCFHYTNLQPLWAKENMSKGSKILPQDPESFPS